MSYLNSPRLTFSGQFQADPSTVNNDPTHYNNATFVPSDQEPQSGSNLNGWWNPNGTGSWRFVGCTVQSVTYKDGTTTSDPTVDPIIGQTIMDSNTRVAGSIVDLDPQQQMVSMLFGVVVRIVADGVDVMKGTYDPAPFTNIFFGRAPSIGGSDGASAIYQSVIKHIVWDIDKSKSTYLKQLHEISHDQLSIEFNVDLYQSDSTNAQFTLGRIAGSIGPSTTAEPAQFVLGRQLFPTNPRNRNFATAIVDEKLKSLVLDLGNSLQVNADGSVAETRELTIAVNQSQTTTPNLVNIGTIDYTSPTWYTVGAGVSTFPLSDELMKLATSFPLVISTSQRNLKNPLLPPVVTLIFTEQVDYVRADQFVFRMNPGETKTVDFYTTSLGALTSGKTGNPRGYIDGQVYAVSYGLSDNDPSTNNSNNFLSILVWDSVPAATIQSPTWADIQPTMQQYANLYPLMSKGIFNLADQTVVDQNAEILKFVSVRTPRMRTICRRPATFRETSSK